MVPLPTYGLIETRNLLDKKSKMTEKNLQEESQSNIKRKSTRGTASLRGITRINCCTLQVFHQLNILL
jgi:hypothetical protein